MIKLKSIGYQQDNVVATVEYDLDGGIYQLTVYAKLLLVAKMTEVEVKDYIRGKVSVERVARVKDAATALLNAILDVDIEE